MRLDRGKVNNELIDEREFCAREREMQEKKFAV
jgi:hypothetical protein